MADLSLSRLSPVGLLAMPLALAVPSGVTFHSGLAVPSGVAVDRLEPAGALAVLPTHFPLLASAVRLRSTDPRRLPRRLT